MTLRKTVGASAPLLSPPVDTDTVKYHVVDNDSGHVVAANLTDDQARERVKADPERFYFQRQCAEPCASRKHRQYDSLDYATFERQKARLNAS